MSAPNPHDPFERVIAWASEADKRTAAEPYVRQYQKGLMTVGELAERLAAIDHEHVLIEGADPTG